jgi:N-acetylglucosaminyl-diphospho-decaprenol L-rhamnosyltransferase
MPDQEVRERPVRRSFTADYKLRVVERANGTSEPGEVGALLSRQGLYSSHLVGWQRLYRAGALHCPTARPDAGQPAGRENERQRGRWPASSGSCRPPSGSSRSRGGGRAVGSRAALPGTVPKCAYVIVAYRSARDLDSCLDAIDRDRKGRPWPIVVVDNASPDDSAAVAKRHRSSPHVVRMTENYGFGTGCNRGAAVCASETIFFVNPDARVTRGVTDRLLSAMDADTHLGIVGAATTDPAGEYRGVSAGAEPSLRSALGHFLFLGRIPVVRRLFVPMYLAPGARSQLVDWVGGEALMVRRSVFEAIGGFDERMFLYMEDVDLCRRSRLIGARVRYLAEAIVEHNMGGSQGPEAVDRWYDAFHAYTSARETSSVRAIDLVATLGLSMRFIAYVLTRRQGQARRMMRATMAASLHALGRHP